MSVRTQLQLVAKYANFISDENLSGLLSNLSHADKNNAHTVEFRFSVEEATKYLRERCIRDIALSEEPRIVKRSAIDRDLDGWITYALEKCNDNLTIDALRGMRGDILETYYRFAEHALK